jgi:purine nucleoside phosphorylase
VYPSFSTAPEIVGEVIVGVLIVGVVKVPDVASALELTAVWIALNSVSNSVPRITLPASPEGSVSLTVKFVLFV